MTSVEVDIEKSTEDTKGNAKRKSVAYSSLTLEFADGFDLV